jgi:hypothetical protein
VDLAALGTVEPPSALACGTREAHSSGDRRPKGIRHLVQPPDPPGNTFRLRRFAVISGARSTRVVLRRRRNTTFRVGRILSTSDYWRSFPNRCGGLCQHPAGYIASGYRGGNRKRIDRFNTTCQRTVRKPSGARTTPVEFRCRKYSLHRGKVSIGNADIGSGDKELHEDIHPHGTFSDPGGTYGDDARNPHLLHCRDETCRSRFGEVRRRYNPTPRIGRRSPLELRQR